MFLKPGGTWIRTDERIESRTLAEDEMNTYGNESGVAGKIVTWFLIGVLAVVALKVGLAVAGFVIGIGFFALFTLGPIVLIGWLIVKALRYLTREPREIAV